MVTVYTKDNCNQCRMTKRELSKRNIAYNEINIENNEQERSRLQALGKKSMPVVVTSKDEWEGFRPDKIGSI